MDEFIKEIMKWKGFTEEMVKDADKKLKMNKAYVLIFRRHRASLLLFSVI